MDFFLPIGKKMNIFLPIGKKNFFFTYFFKIVQMSSKINALFWLQKCLDLVRKMAMVVKKVLSPLLGATHWEIHSFSGEIQVFWSLRSRISCLASPLLRLASLGLRKLASLCMKSYAQGPKNLNFPLEKINLPVFRP